MIEKGNKFAIGSSGDGSVFIMGIARLGRPLSAADAANLAVWLLVNASLEEGGPTKADFDAAFAEAMGS